MAIRTHVAAIRGISLSEARDALTTAGIDTVQKVDEWVWTRVPVGNTDVAALDAALDSCAGPAVRTTTVDGALWELRLSAPDREPFLTEHWFILFEEGRLKREKAEHGDLHEFAERCGMSEALVDDVGSDKLTLGNMRKLLQRHADHVVDQLKAFGIPVDPAEAKKILLGKSVSPIELGWDVGNLPRFLSCLELGDSFPGWRVLLKEEEEDERSRAEAFEAMRADPLQLIREGLANTAVEPIDGDPVAIPLDRLVSLFHIGVHFSSGFDVGLTLDAEDNAPVLEDLVAVYLATTGLVGDSIEVRLDTWPDASKTIRRIATALSGAIDGTRLEFMTTQIYHQTPADQRYEGHLRNGSFVVSATHPPMSRETLEGALDLMRQYVNAKDRVTVGSEAERDDVLSEVADAIWFFNGPPEITPNGLELIIDPADDTDGVIEYLFLRRYADTWDVSRRAEWHRNNSATAAEHRAEAAEYALEPGEHFRVEASEPPGEVSPEAQELIDRAEASDLIHLGWITVVMSAGPIAVCTFATEDGGTVVDINGSVMDGTFQPINVDAFSRLEGGISLTSSTAIFVVSQPEKRIHKFAHPVATFDQLLRWHQKHMEELGAEPELHVATLDDHIAAVEVFLEAESGVEVGAG